MASPFDSPLLLASSETEYVPRFSKLFNHTTETTNPVIPNYLAGSSFNLPSNLSSFTSSVWLKPSLLDPQITTACQVYFSIDGENSTANNRAGITLGFQRGPTGEIYFECILYLGAYLTEQLCYRSATIDTTSFYSNFSDTSNWMHVHFVWRSDVNSKLTINNIENPIPVTRQGSQFLPQNKTDGNPYSYTPYYGFGYKKNTAGTAAERYFHGYISDAYFFLGREIPATSFGRYDTKKGTSERWIPKKYTGTYEQYDHYLQFDTLQGLVEGWKDSSPNNNDFLLTFPSNIPYTGVATTLGWTDCAVSANGQYQVATIYAGTIHTSQNFGQTWVNRSVSGYWWRTAISADGRYIIAVAYGPANPGTFTGGGVIQNSSYGEGTWSLTSLNNDLWYGVAMSSNGQYRAVVAQTGVVGTTTNRIKINQNFGADEDWFDAGPVSNYNSIAMSSNGQLIIALDSQRMFTNNNFGTGGLNTWTETVIPGRSTTNGTIMMDIAISSDGKYQTIVEGHVVSSPVGRIYVSNDYGQSWTVTGPSKNYRSVAMSSNGKIQTAVAEGGVSGGTDQTFRSFDYGVTWLQVGPSAKWSGIAMSSNGQYQTATAYDGLIYIVKMFEDHTSDQTVDVPYTMSLNIRDTGIGKEVRGNYCTLQGFNQCYNGLTNQPVFHRGNLAVCPVGQGNSSWQTAGGTISVPSGKWYFEADIIGQTAPPTTGNVADRFRIGVLTSDVPQNAFEGTSTTSVLGQTTKSWGFRSNGTNLQKITNNTGTSFQFPNIGRFQTGDKLMCALDADNGNIWFGLSGLWCETTYAANISAIENTATQGVGSSWNNIVISYTGQIQFVIDSTNQCIEKSNDYGYTWNRTTAPSLRWFDIAMSYDVSDTGQYVTALGSSSTGISSIYVSNDSGNTWFQPTVADTNNSSVTLTAWGVITMSKTGEIQYGVDTATQDVYKSTDYGVTWAQLVTQPVINLAPSNGLGITCSENGQVVSVVSRPPSGTSPSRVATSIDGGITWTVSSVSTDSWQAGPPGPLNPNTSSPPAGSQVSNGYINSSSIKKSIAMNADGTIIDVSISYIQETRNVTQSTIVYPGGFQQVIYSGTFTRTYYIAIYSSSDFGASWTGPALYSPLSTRTNLVRRGSTSGFFLGSNTRPYVFTPGGTGRDGGAAGSSNFIWDIAISGNERFATTITRLPSLTSSTIRYYNDMLTYNIEGDAFWRDVAGIPGRYDPKTNVNIQSIFSLTNSIAITRDGKTVILLEGSSPSRPTLFGSEPTRLVKSNNYGKTFIATKFPDSTVSVTNIFISFDGQYQLATTTVINPFNGQGPVYRSIDYGNTWTVIPSNQLPNREWINGAMSATGQYQVVTAYGARIYLSSDFGQTWTEIGPAANPNDIYTCVGISDNGLTITAGVFDFGTNSGRVVRSITSGSTWTTVVGAVANRYYPMIGMSRDGVTQLIPFRIFNASGGGLLRSVNSGGTFAAVTFSGTIFNITGVGISDDGRYQAVGTVTTATTNFAPFYVSVNSGANWTAINQQHPLTEAVGEIKMSGNGAYIYGFSSDTSSTGSQIIYTKLLPDPALGTDPAFTNLNTIRQNVSILPGVSFFKGASTEGSPRTNIININYGQLPYNYQAPTNYKSICTSNLPDPYLSKSQEGFNAKRRQGYFTSARRPHSINTRLSVDTSSSLDTSRGLVISSNLERLFSTIESSNPGSVERNVLVFFSPLSDSPDDVSRITLAGELGEPPGSVRPYGMAITPDQEYLYIVDNANNRLLKCPTLCNFPELWTSFRIGTTDGSVVTSILKPVAMSPTGQYQTVAVEGRQLRTNNNFGQGTWSIASNPLFWQGIAMSSDGRYQTAITSGFAEAGINNIYRNDNYGEGTWTAVGPGFRLAWAGIAMSSTGQYQIATGRDFSEVYMSSDYGLTWNQITDPGLTGLGNEGSQVAISATGQKIVIVFSQSSGVPQGTVATNNNFGQGSWLSFYLENSNNIRWRGVAMSDDGNYITLVSPDIIYRTSDGGSTWGKVGAFNAFALPPTLSKNFRTVTMSPDGRLQLITNDVTTNNEGLLKSADYGETWHRVPGSTRLQGAAMSTDGRNVTVVSVGPSVPTVYNTLSGAFNLITTLTSNNLNQPQFIDITPDGNYLYVTNKGNNTLLEYNLQTNSEAVYSTGLNPVGVKVSPDGQYVVTANNDSDNLTFLDTQSKLTLNVSTTSVPVSTDQVQIGKRPRHVYITNDSEQVFVTSNTTSGPPGIVQLTIPKPFTTNYVDWDDGNGSALVVNIPGFNGPTNFIDGTNDDTKLYVTTNNYCQFYDRTTRQVGLTSIATGRGDIVKVDDNDEFVYVNCEPTPGSPWITAARSFVHYPVSLDFTPRIVWTKNTFKSANHHLAYSMPTLTNDATQPDLWLPTNSINAQWNTLRMNYSGNGIVAAPFGQQRGAYISGDYGKTWTQPFLGPDSYNFIDYCFSQDPEILFTVITSNKSNAVDNIYRYALNNWTNIDTLTAAWTGIACSADGTHITAVANQKQIRRTTNYNFFDGSVTWGNVGSALAWTCVAMSSSGLFQTAGVDSGRLYRSVNSGATWSAVGPTGKSWREVAISGNGQFQAAVAEVISGGAQGPDRIYRSNNHGGTWTAVGNTELWRTITMDETGQYQVATTYNRGVFKSDNYGITWYGPFDTPNTGPVRMSKDGQRQVRIRYVNGVAESDKLYVRPLRDSKLLTPTKSRINVGVTNLASSFITTDVNNGSLFNYYDSRTNEGVANNNYNLQLGLSTPGALPATLGYNSEDSFIDFCWSGNSNLVSVVEYVGDGNASKFINHGLTTKPAMIIIKRKDSSLATAGWNIWMKEFLNTAATTHYLTWAPATVVSDATVFRNATTTWNETRIEIGASARVNALGGYYTLIAFAEIEGFCKVGVYNPVSTASTWGPFVHTGFTPKFLLIKRTSTTNWVLYTKSLASETNPLSQTLNPNTNAGIVDISNSVDFYANGFKLRSTNTAINVAANNFHYIAFAEAPFKYSQGELFTTDNTDFV